MLFYIYFAVGFLWTLISLPCQRKYFPESKWCDYAINFFLNLVLWPVAIALATRAWMFAILFLFPLLCFGQSKTPLLRPVMQSNGDGNHFAWTNLDLIGSGFSDSATNFLNTYIAPSWGRAIGALTQQPDLEGKPVGQFVLLSVGDSVAYENSASMAMSLFPMIYRAHGRNGTELESAGNTHRVWFLGTVQSMPQDAFWFAGYYAVNNASSVTWSNDFNSLGSFCNYVNVYYVRHPGGGNFRVQSSVNGAAYSDIGTLSGFNATPIGGFTNITFGQNMNKFRIVSDASTNYIIGIGDGYNGAQQGFVTAHMSLSGIGTANITNVPRAIRDVVLTNLFRNRLGGLIVAHMKEDGTAGTDLGLRDMNSWFNLTTNQNVTTVWVGTTAVSADTNTTPPFTIAQNYLVKSNAYVSDISYFDAYKYFGAYPKMLADGFNVDGTHPSQSASDMMAQGFMNEFGLNNTLVANSWERAPLQLAYDGYGTLGNSAYPLAPLTTAWRNSLGGTIIQLADGVRFSGNPGDSSGAYIQGDANYIYMNAPIGSGGINFSVNGIPLTLGRAHTSGGWSLGGVGADPGLGNVNIFGTLGVLKGANVTSAATITPSGAIFHVTAGNTISTINLPWTGFTGSIVLIPDNLWSTSTVGNIALATTAVVNKAVTMTYDGTKWYPSY